MANDKRTIEYIETTDTLNEGRVKINDAITGANDALDIARDADDKATEALSNSESTQTQLDTIVIDGDSSVEAAQARVPADGPAYDTLKQRLDTEMGEVTSQLAEITHIVPPPTGGDDTEMIQQIINTGYNVSFSKTDQPYLISEGIIVTSESQKIIGNGMMNTIIKANVENINGIILKAENVYVSDLQVKDFTYNRDDEGERHGIRTEGVDNCIIQRVFADNCDDAGIRISHLFNTSNPKLSKPSKNCRVLHCITRNTRNGSGIELLNAEGTIVDGCMSIDSAFHGIRLAGARGSIITNNRILNYGLGDMINGDGIYIRGGVNRGGINEVAWSSSDNIITNNFITGGLNAFSISNESTNITIAQNNVYLTDVSRGTGFFISNNNSVSRFGSNNVSIFNNRVTGEYKHAVLFDEGGENIQITNNVFRGFTETGVYINTDNILCENVLILNNDFHSEHQSGLEGPFGFRNFRRAQSGITVNGNTFNIPNKDLVFRDIHGGCYRGAVSTIGVERSGDRLVYSTHTTFSLETGDRVQLSTTGTLPYPLETNKDYYIIRDSAHNRLKIADTPLKALNSEGIPLVDAGIGDHYFMTSPRDTNIVV